ncbi:uncharacterized protein L969DRAFT_401297 [Mixia osmundae IAM 14324]|uniref:uncharacterized protein n=1 Tax=Mixia osmundae (strain CBS 9802 / IAM 14324 / JCM 22182 / KY 12970) TaxID=764103 RepID=UPI0004A546F5|nr:uncharacterized protein L969DRAFT_401297 [Mixia osmundae IAM 14324]KEI40063.1 hypothetical protein L969DRAFT_401297 [Mixia osmundae IAM 14324]
MMLSPSLAAVLASSLGHAVPTNVSTLSIRDESSRVPSAIKSLCSSMLSRPHRRKRSVSTRLAALISRSWPCAMARVTTTMRFDDDLVCISLCRGARSSSAPRPRPGKESGGYIPSTLGKASSSYTVEAWPAQRPRHIVGSPLQQLLHRTHSSYVPLLDYQMRGLACEAL